jgi:hypothetical protein
MESLQQNTANNPEDLETATKEEVFTEEPSNGQGTPDRVQYEFVDMITDSLARSHAMKMYWRQKKGARERREQNWSENQRAIRPLLPAKTSEVQPRDTSRELKSHEVALIGSESVAQPTQDTSLRGLSDQLWAGLRFPFSGIHYREKNDFPFQVTVEHRKLFYHC